jgi:hypothetical protein
MSFFWLWIGVWVLTESEVANPKSIKQFLFQSIVTGPGGVFMMFCWYLQRINFPSVFKIIKYINDKLK